MLTRLTHPSALRTLVLIWAGWLVVVLGFQALAAARFSPAWPDRALEWTETETKSPDYQHDKPYLLNPFMNQQVAWDSEFYLAIATGGYDDPLVRKVPNTTLSLSYAFMPFYPFVMGLVAFPLRALGMPPIPAATLAGVIVSALGTLLGMWALYDLTREELEESGGLRAAFYLIAFPTGFFLAQVYTEGLFVGLAFACLALLRRKRLWQAALLGALATWTRAVGVALIFPLVWPWLASDEWMELDLEWQQIYHQGLPWKAIGRALLFLSPLVAYLVWRFSYLGMAFSTVEELYFGRGLLSLGTAFYTWREAFFSLFGPHPARAAYYLIEFGAIALGFTACFAVRRRYPAVAWFSLAVLLLSFTSGPAQGMHRYILGAPATFIALGQWGRHSAFDRVWTILSVLLMGLLATLFAFNMWVA